MSPRQLTTPFPNTRKVSCQTEAEIASKRRRERMRAETDALAGRAIRSTLAPTNGEFRDALLISFAAIIADVLAEHRDGAFANTILGLHAGRVAKETASLSKAAARKAVEDKLDVEAQRLFANREREAA